MIRDAVLLHPGFEETSPATEGVLFWFGLIAWWVPEKPGAVLPRIWNALAVAGSEACGTCTQRFGHDGSFPECITGCHKNCKLSRPAGRKQRRVA